MGFPPRALLDELLPDYGKAVVKRTQPSDLGSAKNSLR
jgi:hypothetical protein